MKLYFYYQNLIISDFKIEYKNKSKKILNILENITKLEKISIKAPEVNNLEKVKKFKKRKFKKKKFYRKKTK